ncbi:Hypothetical predicted protein [Octopus vulgaris]|uniref:Uncharacterized protein n=1 Tax=Octopus vulgaris TaxID=6645 RepID=A0AA36BSC5_OCTVU|nr:Hypothetical predicted protein [Octopus vulgaris]
MPRQGELVWIQTGDSFRVNLENLERILDLISQQNWETKSKCGEQKAENRETMSVEQLNFSQCSSHKTKQEKRKEGSTK